MTGTTCMIAAVYGARDGRAAGTAAARRAVARLLGHADPAGIDIVSRPGQSPLAQLTSAGMVRTLPVAVSVAHTRRGAVAIAAHAHARIGVDMEPARAVGRKDTGFFLTRRELTYAQRLGPTALWCLKEAAWKALGLGAHVPFKRLELVFDETGGRLVAVRARGRTWRVSARLRRVRRSGDHWITAVVLVGDELQRRAVAMQARRSAGDAGRSS